jgi:DNA-binding transcriptional MerR regulator
MTSAPKPSKYRPVDLAREHGLSTQAVRNYEAAGILPAADRSASGYRVYTLVHAAALRTFLALVPGHGHGVATAVLAAVNRGAVDEALALIDDSHSELRTDRLTLDSVERAVAQAVPTEDIARQFLSVREVARRIGVEPTTLRSWEDAGLAPARDPATGYRVYGPADIRDAHLVHQLRRGGYLLNQIAPIVAQVRSAGSIEALAQLIGEWRERVNTRGRSMLLGAAALQTYLDKLYA